MNKPCPKCGVVNFFSDDYRKKNGYRCNPCGSKASVEWAKSHREWKRKKNNAYYSKRSAMRAEKTAKWRANHPDRRRAHQAVQTGKRNGTIIPKPCETCGSTHRVHAHHDDYSKPLEIAWLCHIHHMERHAMLKAREGGAK
jgi:hypothetical protein